MGNDSPTTQSQDGTTSIVVVADDDLESVRSCLAAIERHTIPGCYELIVVTSSRDSSVSEWLSIQDGLTHVVTEPGTGSSGALNAGIASASCGNVLLLSSGVVVPSGYLPAMLAALHSEPAVGAVGPVMDGVPGQMPQSCYPLTDTHDEVPGPASDRPSRWDRRLRLSSRCLLVKREILDSLGSFDGAYRSSSLHDDDLSFRMITSGLTLLLVRDVFAESACHPPPSPNSPGPMIERERRHFARLWGIDPTYSTIQRSEVVALLDPPPPGTTLRVLEVGCAAGATLLEIKNRFPTTELYGIEKNDGAAAIGGHFADIRSTDAEAGLDYPNEFFDYVITADVLEHLVDPWRVVAAIRPHLKESGKLIASIPNIMHFSVMRSLVNGRFAYADAGILDRTHLRFFTLREIDALFATAGYGSRSYTATAVPATDDDLLFVNALKELATINASDQFLAYQYLAAVAKSPA